MAGGRDADYTALAANCSPNIRHSPARRSASGATPDGAAWFGEASIATAASADELVERLRRRLVRDGTRNRRRPG